MIHALHGNVGLTDDLHGLLTSLQRPFHSWHLWQWIREHSPSATLQSFAAALNDSAQQRGERPRVVLGYSLGGRLALHALIQNPAIWDAAVILSAHPGLPNDAERAVRLKQDEIWAERFLHEPWEELMTDWNRQSVFLQGSIGCCGSLESWRREISRAFDVWSLGRQNDLRPLLPAITCPVLWLTGERDAKFAALASGVCQSMRRAQHAVIPNAGHRVQLDQPDAVAAAIGSFLLTAGG